MKRAMLMAAAMLLTAGMVVGPALAADDLEVGEKPLKAHQWLQQLLGDWKTEVVANVGPDQPAFRCEGEAVTKPIGELWVSIDIENRPMGHTMRGILTIGYDARNKQYVGTWVDSMTSHLWKYQGSLDASGKILTLQAEGPSMLEPGNAEKMAKYRDVIEVKDKDHLVMKSSIETEPGTWVEFMTMDYRRKK